MFGKLFASLYTGSMFGQPAIVFAVWGYAVANMRPARKTGTCFVELNPTLLAAMFKSTVAEVLDALRYLTSDDPRSRSPEQDGRRLVVVGGGEVHDGPQQFEVVNGAKYRAIRDEEERRVANAEYQRAHRARQAASENMLTVSHGQPPSAQVEVEVEVEAVRTDSSSLSSSSSAASVDEGESEGEKGLTVPAQRVLLVSPPMTPPRPRDVEIAEKMLAVFNAAFGRKVRVIDPDVLEKIRSHLKQGRSPHLLASMPLLVAARDMDPALRRRLDLDLLLRDGKHGGKEWGNTNWVAREAGRLDQTKLGPALTAIAREHGLLDALVAMGVRVTDA